MRTAAICPTCATYTNSVCVIYDGPYLSNLGISPTSSLEDALQQINSVAGTFEKTANKSTNITADQSSNVKYPSVKAVYDWVTSAFGPALTFTPENVANKSINIVTDQSSNTKYPSVKAVYDWVTANFQSSLGFTPENVANKSTNVSLGTSNTLYPTQNAVKTYVDTAISAIPAPNLQQVTDIGNTTDNDINISNNVVYSSFTVTSTGGNGTARIAYADDWKGHVLINNGSFSGVIRANNLTASRQIQLPNANGTLATSVNGVQADASGNITISGTTYLVYTALISTSGGAISSVVVLENTLGQTITWTVPSNGRLRATSTGTPFTVGKTWMTSGGFNNGSSPMIVTSAQGNAFPTSTIDYNFFLHDGTQSSTPNIDDYSVEIRVYP